MIYPDVANPDLVPELERRIADQPIPFKRIDDDWAAPDMGLEVGCALDSAEGHIAPDTFVRVVWPLMDTLARESFLAGGSAHVWR